MLSRLTGQTIPQEARPMTCSYNLVRAIRKRRLKWLGDILRAGTNRITYKAVIEQKQLGLPPDATLEELAVKAKDRGYWKSLVASIP